MPRDRSASTLLILATAALAYSFMQTLVLPALPVFAADFDARATDVGWIASVFLLTSAVSMPIISRVGDIHGKVRVLTATMAVFGAATLAAGFAPNLPTLIACRAVQGVGGAVFPLAFGIVRDRLPAERVGFGIGVVSSLFGVGTGFGFVASGFVLEELSWRWLFFLGLVPIAAAVVTLPRLPESPRAPGARPDWIGGGLLSVGLVATLLAVTEAQTWGWASAPLLALVALGLSALVAWVFAERHVAHPMVDMQVFSRAPLVLLNLSTFFIGYAMFAVYTLLPGLLTADPHVAGYGFAATPVQVGLFFVPLALSMLAIGPSAGGSRRIGPVGMLRVGVVGLLVGLTVLGLAHDATVVVCGCMLLIGVGCGACLAVLGRLVVQACQPHETGVASGINTVLRTIGGAVSAQIGATVLEGTATGGGPPAEAGYRAAFLMASAGAALALVSTFALSAADARTRKAPDGWLVPLQSPLPTEESIRP
jgi:MFS family permease